jgi:hypothetical protein
MPLTSQRAPLDVRHLVPQHRHRQIRNLGPAYRAFVGLGLVHGIEVGSDCGGQKGPAGGETDKEPAGPLDANATENAILEYMNERRHCRAGCCTPVGVGVSGDHPDNG